MFACHRSKGLFTSCKFRSNQEYGRKPLATVRTAGKHCNALLRPRKIGPGSTAQGAPCQADQRLSPPPAKGGLSPRPRALGFFLGALGPAGAAVSSRRFK